MTDRWKLIIGGLLTLGLLGLGAAIALGHVEEKSSFGLTAVFALLGKVELDFSSWAFAMHQKDAPAPATPTIENQ